MKNFFLLALAGLALTTACKKDDDSTPAVTMLQVTGSLAGANEVPAVTSAGTGAVVASYNKTSKVLTYTVTYSGITPTAGHFHLGNPGTTGAVFIPFSSLTSPITGTATLTQTQEDALVAGGVYANLHTTANPNGEIRANVVAK